MFTRLADAGAQIVVNDLLPWDEDGLYPDHRKFDWTPGRRRPRRPPQALRDRRHRRVDRRRRDRGPLRERQVPRRDGARDRQRRPPGAGALPDELPRPRRAAAARPLEVLPGPARGRHDPDRAAPGRARRLRVGDPGDPGVDRPREDAPRHHESVLHRRRHDPARDRRGEARRQGADRRLAEVEQPAGDGRAQAPLQRAASTPARRSGSTPARSSTPSWWSPTTPSSSAPSTSTPGRSTETTRSR